LINGIRELVKRVDGCAILSIPADIDDDLLEKIADKVCAYVGSHQLHGVVIDFSNLIALDRVLAEALFDMARAISTLGPSVQVCGICPGLASSLALLGFETGGIPVAGTLDSAIQAIG